MGSIEQAFAGSVRAVVAGSVFVFHEVGWAISAFIRENNLS